MVTIVGDVQVASGIHGGAVGRGQLGAGGRAVVAAVAWRPVPRHGGDHSVRDLADAVTLVGDVEVAGGVRGDTGGRPQLGAGGRAIVVHHASAARHGGDHATRNLADAVVVGDVEVAGGIHRNALGQVQLGAGGRAVVADYVYAARHGGDHPIRDLAHAGAKRVGDVQVAGGIHGHA